MGKPLELTGQKYNRLLVLGLQCTHKTNSGTQYRVWKCRCDCGNICYVSSNELRRGRTKSCGCYNNDRIRTHSQTKTRLYKIYQGMKARTGAIGKKHSDQYFRNYISRGIAISDEWRTFEAFRDWAISNGYNDNLQIDRIDNNKGYSANNCRWVTKKANEQNRRNALRFPNGEILSTVCDKLGIVTFENGLKTKQYNKVAEYWRRLHKLHPMFIDACVKKHVCPHKFLISADKTVEVEEI